MMNIISTKEQLIKVLKDFKEEGMKNGLIEEALYPAFVMFLNDNKDKIKVELPTYELYDTSLDIFLDLGEDENE
jgi:hypothetical protein